VGRPLWREVESVFSSFSWASPEQPFSSLSPFFLFTVHSAQHLRYTHVSIAAVLCVQLASYLQPATHSLLPPPLGLPKMFSFLLIVTNVVNNS
jgi:urea transporter